MSKTAPEETLQAVVERFWESVPPAWHTIRSNIRVTAAADFDISVEQFHVLRHIRKGMETVSELAAARQISRPAISQAVDVLVAKGLVRRAENAADRRYVRLTLTPAGEELIGAIFAKNCQWMLERLSALEADEARDLLRGMEVLKRVFVEAAS